MELIHGYHAETTVITVEDALFQDYKRTLTEMTDGFFDDLIASAAAYRLFAPDGRALGFFSVLDDGMLSSFYLPRAALRDAKPLFECVCGAYAIKGAYAVSCDSLMISLAFERARATGGSFEMQAYCFEHNAEARVRPAEFGRALLRRVAPDEFEWMNSLTENEWATLKDRSDVRFYVIEADGEPLGFGSYIPQRLFPGRVDVGNHVRPEHRRKGVGRSLILNITEIVLSEGLTPEVGCWYYNAESRPTLESAGYVSACRLFNVKFGQ